MRTATSAAATAADSRTGAAKAKTDAVSLLKADHRKVEQIFAQFEETEDKDEKRKLVRQVCVELIVHTKLEEELFYPACREHEVDQNLMDEAQVEHDGTKVLIADLLRGSPDEEFYDAKVKTLSEYVKHHVSEEEKPRSGIFAKAQKSGLDMAELGQKLQSRKTELMAQSDALTSRPPQPRSFQLQPQEESIMTRYSNDRDRDERGRFTDDDDRSGRSRGRYASDDDERGRSSAGRGQGGWFGDPRGHSEASREGWEERGPSRSSRGREDDDRGRGREQGGWFGDPEGHSRASHEGWEERGSNRSSRSRYEEDDDRGEAGRSSSGRGHGGWFSDPRGHSEASREGWERSGHEGSGWYGDPEGHSRASREGWDERGSTRSSRSRNDDDDDRSSRSRSSGGRGHGGWFGDSRGHSEASREGWRDR